MKQQQTGQHFLTGLILLFAINIIVFVISLMVLGKLATLIEQSDNTIQKVYLLTDRTKNLLLEGRRLNDLRKEWRTSLTNFENSLNRLKDSAFLPYLGGAIAQDVILTTNIWKKGSDQFQTADRYLEKVLQSHTLADTKKTGIFPMKEFIRDEENSEIQITIYQLKSSLLGFDRAAKEFIVNKLQKTIQQLKLRVGVIKNGVIILMLLLSLALFVISIWIIKILRNKEDELREAHALTQNSVNSMPSVFVGINNKEKVILWNREAELFTGLSAENAKNRTVKEVLPEISLYIDDILEAMYQEKQRIKRKIPLYKEGILTSYLDLLIYPIVNGKVEGAVIRLDDVTERVRMEERMVQTEKIMAIGGVAAGMAHEIKNPLSGILQTIQNTLRRLNPELAKNRDVAERVDIDLHRLNQYLEERGIIHYLESIKKASDRVTGMVQNMLLFSRTSDSKKKEVEPASIIEHVLELAYNDYDLKKKYGFRDIKIIREYQNNIPQIACTPIEIEQVILNLIRNASQAMSENGPEKKPILIIRIKKIASWLCFEVEDNGPGIEESIKHRIFDPFFTTKTIGAGTGLGLSVSNFIITQNHQGLFQVDSTPGLGTRFTIKLPTFTDDTTQS